MLGKINEIETEIENELKQEQRTLAACCIAFIFYLFTNCYPR
jgi:hypothetical protein